MNNQQIDANSYIFINFINPFLIVNGLIFNITLFLIFLFKKKKLKNIYIWNKDTYSYVPYGFLIMAILVCDTYYLLSRLNIWLFFILQKPNLTTYNFLCQIISYLDYLSLILINFFILIGNYIICLLLSNRNPIFEKSTDDNQLVNSTYNTSNQYNSSVFLPNSSKRSNNRQNSTVKILQTPEKIKTG